MAKGQRDLYRVTVNGGITVSSGKGIGPTAAVVHTLINDGKKAYVRKTGEDHVCVTFKPGFPPETEAHNQLGDRRDNPPWVQSIINYIINP